VVVKALESHDSLSQEGNTNAGDEPSNGVKKFKTFNRKLLSYKPKSHVEK